MLNAESTAVKKIISDLAIEGFWFHEDFDEIDERRFGEIYTRRRLDNVVFEKDGFILKIHRDLFFRVTGISHLFDESLQKSVRVSDYEFYEMQKHLIRYRFEQKLKQHKMIDPDAADVASVSTISNNVG
ncbi:MAG: hypothetical protein ACOYN4_16410 [Bacteroidales bacterium]